ncbi:glycoside hydrolase [Phycomyces nitens]|nr:glycoside hydrolase [Phycomyces nitens]
MSSIHNVGKLVRLGNTRPCSWGLVLLMVWFISIQTVMTIPMTEQRRIKLREMSSEMFNHGWHNYLNHAYPADELNPFQCNGRGSDKSDPTNININDVLGDYSLTLVDTLDTLAIMGTQAQFEEAVGLVLEQVSFDKDSKVQVFELNIRALGGLLSAHIFASDPSFGHSIKGYNGGLLKLAQDLANRLLPAFQSSKSGIPYPRVNLRYGVPRTETVETCTAGAGSLVLEFGVLSRLTGNPYYERVAKRALKAIWDRRSSLDLLGNVINIQTGQWIHTASSTGAGIDSFFEYILKAYVLFGETEYLDMFEDAYRGILQHIRDPSGYIYRNVHMSSGTLMATWIDSLSAFMPGLQVLHGDLESAIKGHLIFYNIWKRYHALPERFDYHQKTVDIAFYPLRPEFVESTYHLYRATRDPFYLEVGEMIIQDLNNRTRLACGFANIGDVRTGRLEDRMESFMLSETLKYLYLLFDVSHPLNLMDSNFVFTTEGHVLPLPRQYLVKETTPSIRQTFSKRICEPHRVVFKNPVYRPFDSSVHYLSQPQSLDLSSVPYRPETDLAAEMVGTLVDPLDTLSPVGTCNSPIVNDRSFELSFGPDTRGGNDRHKSPKIIEFVGGFLARSLSDLKIELSKRSWSTGGGYQVTGVQPNTRLSKSDVLIVTKDAILPYLRQDVLEIISLGDNGAPSSILQQKTFELRVHCQTVSRTYRAYPSYFGSRWASQVGFPVLLGDGNRFGCNPYSENEKEYAKGKVLVVHRGICTFYQKARFAEEAEALAVLFIDRVGGQTFRALPAIDFEDDGGYARVNLPSAMVSFEDGLALIDSLKKDDVVLEWVSGVRGAKDLNSEMGISVHGEKVHNLLVVYTTP